MSFVVNHREHSPIGCLNVASGTVQNARRARIRTRTPIQKRSDAKDSGSGEQRKGRRRAGPGVIASQGERRRLRAANAGGTDERNRCVGTADVHRSRPDGHGIVPAAVVSGRAENFGAGGRRFVAARSPRGFGGRCRALGSRAERRAETPRKRKGGEHRQNDRRRTSARKDAHFD